MRGPGETQLETDRRLINNRIKLLKERLVDVTRARVVQRSSRKGEFRVSLVGYTNAGKSSVLRALAGDSQVFVEDRLFATLDPLTREVKLGEHQKALVTDTVGFIRKLPHHLVASFRATLEEVNDVRSAAARDRREPLDVGGSRPRRRRRARGARRHGQAGAPRVQQDRSARSTTSCSRCRSACATSIRTRSSSRRLSDGGLEPLMRALVTRVRTMRPVSEVRIPAGDGRLVGRAASRGRGDRSAERGLGAGAARARDRGADWAAEAGRGDGELVGAELAGRVGKSQLLLTTTQTD